MSERKKYFFLKIPHFLYEKIRKKSEKNNLKINNSFEILINYQFNNYFKNINYFEKKAILKKQFRRQTFGLDKETQKKLDFLNSIGISNSSFLNLSIFLDQKNKNSPLIFDPLLDAPFY